MCKPCASKGKYQVTGSGQEVRIKISRDILGNNDALAVSPLFQIQNKSSKEDLSTN